MSSNKKIKNLKNCMDKKYLKKCSFFKNIVFMARKVETISFFFSKILYLLNYSVFNDKRNYFKELPGIYVTCR